MKIPTSFREKRLDFNMTPLIDVVFLLIIFFIVSSHLAKQEAQLELDLPDAASGDEPSFDQTTRITVNILADGDIQLTGQTMLPYELKMRLLYEKKLNSDENGDELEIRIRTDRNVEYRYVASVLRSCAEAGLWNVKFAVISEADRS